MKTRSLISVGVLTAAMVAVAVAAFWPTPRPSDAPSIIPPHETPDKMVWIPGGRFLMGNDTGPPDEAPVHDVHLDGFWMDATEVTNRQFTEFIDATGYVTTAERQPKLRSIRPGSDLERQVESGEILPEMNVPGSICHLRLDSREDIDPQKGVYSW